MPECNGFRSYSVWNQVLHLHNHEGDYRYILGLRKRNTIEKATKIAWEVYKDQKTYDGQAFTKEGVREAIRHVT